jgi:hypothetical protein
VAKKSVYGVHPGVLMTQKWVAGLKEKTGRTVEEWTKLLKKSGAATAAERRDWLQKEHGMGRNSATSLADWSLGKGREMTDPELYLQAAEQYVEKMYSGSKAGLLPIYHALLKLGLATGKDVKACPCQTMVPLYRNHVFAQIKPTTTKRIDLGFALGARPVEGKLVDTGGYAKKDRITHRIPIASVEEIDDEVKHWLRIAHEGDA